MSLAREMTWPRLVLGAACASIVVALMAARSSNASRATTGPGRQHVVYLVETEKGFTFHNVDLTHLDRGSYLRFFVFNEGKKTHQLQIEGVRTPRIKPGGRGQTRWILFNRRGTFRFFDPTDRGLSGTIQIL